MSVNENPPRGIGFASWALLVVGAASMLAQITLLREVFSLVRGNELLVGAVLGGWLALTGAFTRLGAYLGSSPHRIGLVLAVAPLLFQGSLWLLPSLGRPDDLLPGETLGFFREFLFAMLSILPATAFGGLAYASAVANQSLDGVSAGFTCENLGAAIAGTAFHFLLADHYGSVTILTATGVAAATVAIPFLWPRSKAVALLFPASIVLVVLFFTSDNEKQLTELVAPGERVIATRPSNFGRLVVVEREGRRVILQNGVLVAATEDEARSEEAARLPMLLHPAPRSALIVGGCLSHVLVEVLAHAPDRVHCLETDGALVDLARTYLAAPVVKALSDPRVTVLSSDLRLHARAYPAAYDVILLPVPVPRSPYLARALTVESFVDAGRALRPGGLLAVSSPGRMRGMDKAMLYRHAMLSATLRAVFPHVAFAPGETSLVWASIHPLSVAIEPLVHRLVARHLPPGYVGEGWIADRLQPFNVDQYKAALAQLHGHPNHELRPGMYVAGMVEDLAPTLPWLAETLIAWMDAWWLLALFALAPLLLGLYSRWAPQVLPPPSFAAMVVGATGMAMSVLTMLCYQSLRGHLYHSLGGLLALFMGGMVLGSVLGRRLAKVRSGLAWACGASAAVGALSIWTVALAQAVPSVAIWVLLGLSFLVGTATGSAYTPAVNASLATGNPGSRIYALDLLGASLVAVGASWAVLPLLGFPALGLLVSLACSVAALVNLRTPTLS